MSCDIRICSDNAVFGQPEVAWASPPASAEPRDWPVWSAPNGEADDLHRKKHQGGRAYRIGLVNAVYPQEEAEAAAEKMAAGIAKNAPIAVRNCKKAINEGLDADMDEAIVIEEKLFGDCFESYDQKEGMAAFQ